MIVALGLSTIETLIGLGMIIKGVNGLMILKKGEAAKMEIKNLK